MWTFGLENVKGRSQLEDDGFRWVGGGSGSRKFVKEIGVMF